MGNKLRKTINVSLQSKKYCGPMNDLINEWEEDGSNLSTKVCEQLLKLNKLEQSATIVNVLTMFDLVEKMGILYEIEDSAILEEVLSKVIRVDMQNLSEITLTLSQMKDSTLVKKSIESIDTNVSTTPMVQVENTVVTPKAPEIQKIEPIVQKVVESKVEETTSDEMEIPMDFLFNS